MSANKKVDKGKRYLDNIKFTLKRSKNTEYNIQAVAKMLGLPSENSYNSQCRIIISHLDELSKKNKYIAEILDNIPDTVDLCDFLVGVLYELLSPKKLPSKAPIKISAERYNNLINKKKNKERLTVDEEAELKEALNCKYCHCVKKLYLKNNFDRYINNKDPNYNEYAICMSAIYKNRNFNPPHRVSYSCRDKYEWYK